MQIVFAYADCWFSHTGAHFHKKKNHTFINTKSSKKFISTSIESSDHLLMFYIAWGLAIRSV